MATAQAGVGRGNRKLQSLVEKVSVRASPGGRILAIPSGEKSREKSSEGMGEVTHKL